jgi:hypothetical protein
MEMKVLLQRKLAEKSFASLTNNWIGQKTFRRNSRDKEERHSHPTSEGSQQISFSKKAE